MERFTLTLAVFFTAFACYVRCQNPNILQCGSFTAGQAASMQLTVDNATFTSCDAGPGFVTCSLKPKVGAATPLCVQNVTHCVTKETDDGCRCVQRQGTKLSYELKFTPQSAQEGGNITCDFDCVIIPGSGKQPPNVTSTPECLGIQFEDPCEDKNCGEKGNCYVDEQNGLATCSCPVLWHGDACEKYSDEMIAVIVVLIFVVSTATTVISCFYFRRKKCRFLRTSDPNTTLEQVEEAAEKVMRKLGGQTSVSIVVLRGGEYIFVVIQSRNIIKLNQAVEEMKSAVPGLEEFDSSKDPGELPPDYPRDPPSLGNSFSK